MVKKKPKTNSITIFFSWCNLLLKFGNVTSGFNSTERREAGNYPIVFWSMTSKAEFAITIRRVRPFYTYKEPTTDIILYTLRLFLVQYTLYINQV